MKTHDIIRRCRFSPYRKGMGPTFALTMWDAGRSDYRGVTTIGYRLVQRFPRKRPIVLFTGEDFNGSPMHAIDSNETVKALMSFLTLRPGDTDAEYFADYTPAQIEYCNQHAEALGCEILCRFGE